MLQMLLCSVATGVHSTSGTWVVETVGQYLYLSITKNCVMFTVKKNQKKKLTFETIAVTILQWATSRQNQQNNCASSEDSDQPGQPPSLIKVFAVRMKKTWVLSYPMSAQRRLIRLGGCPGWSESSLGAQSFCWFCHEAAQMQEKV